MNLNNQNIKNKNDKGSEAVKFERMVRHFCGWGQEPYPENSPVLLSWDTDLGWIVETVEDGEYEVQNLPHYETEGRNLKPDFELAIEEANKRNVRVKYYHDWENA